MNKFEVSIEFEESPASNSGSAIFVEVTIGDKKFEDILDVHEFFRSLNEEGVFEYFTCTCGIFGCGGFYSVVEHSKKSYVLRNIYLPEDDFSDENILEMFSMEISWENIISVAEEILEAIRDFYKTNRGVELTVGIAGGYIHPYIDEFQKSLDKVRVTKILKNVT